MVILWANKISYTVRITGCFFIISILVILLPICANYAHPDVGFPLCIIIMLVFGVLNGFLQASVFGFAGMLPPKYIGAVMFGNGLSGITTNILQAICLVAFPPSVGNN